MRTRSAALALLVSALAIVPAVGMAGVAAADELDPVIVYRGDVTSTTTDGYSATLAATATIDCSTQPCRISAEVTNGSDTASLTGRTSYEIVDGHFEADIPPVGEICADDYTPAIHVAIDVTPDSARFRVTGQDSGEVDCSDGSTVEYDAGRIDGTIPYVSGSTCLIDGSCATPSPAAGPVVSPVRPAQPRPAADPGVLSTLPAPVEVLTPKNIAWAVAGSVVLVILIALPTALYDSVADVVSGAVAAWWARLRRRARPGSAEDRAERSLTIAGWPAALVGLGIAGVVSTFVDPRLGPDLAGLRTVASVLLSFAIAVALGWVATLLAVRRTHPGMPARLEFRPPTLLIVLAAVVFSRLTGFEPGLVFGLVAGVVLGGALATADRARFALVGLLWSFGIGIVAWIAYAFIPASGGLVFLRETLSAVAVAGLAALPIALLPLRGLVGHDLWTWRKPVWTVVYLVGMFAFLLVLLRAPFAVDHVDASVWAWGGLFAAYAVAAVVLWLVVTKPWKRSTEVA